MSSYNPFAHQIQLNLNTGETKQVTATGVTTARQYFGSLTTLNQSAHVYGCVYLATVEALEWLNDEIKSCPHCSRELEDEEIDEGVCSSDDCPRHDNSCQICGEDGGTKCGAVNCGY